MALEPPRDPTAWAEDLDVAGRRRFWLLLKLINDGHPVADAIAAAQKIERFLATGIVAVPAPAPKRAGLSASGAPAGGDSIRASGRVASLEHVRQRREETDRGERETLEPNPSR